MGFDMALIIGNTDEELLCPICTDILENPVQSPICEHAYCKECIGKWIREKNNCPVDRTQLSNSQLVPASRLMRAMLGRLKIKCCYFENGCPEVVQLEDFRSHLASCDHNPKMDIKCSKGCGLTVPKDEMSEHNCVVKLRELVMQQRGEVVKMKEALADQQNRISYHRRELEMLQHYITGLRYSNTVVGTIGDQLDRFSLMQWGNALRMGRITDWGSLISTPDIFLHLRIRDGLAASHCPLNLINKIADRCHEDRWPDGLANLENRRANHQSLVQYVLRILPITMTAKSCVVLLDCDNSHMPENLRPGMGMVMIFDDGVVDAMA
ncbi:E3 ubiquitin-protein ligase NRDP1 [Drosophila tropicalis]|uniref:E3 ubiquitin-protein ligase NRDP1 n=1 Tax=Drosophila tropicalis TaxID=46794 RepID=UPI0035ABAEB2